MANARGKTTDTTYLSVDKAEERGFLHRDYIAHVFRWTHVVKELNRKHSYKEARILDIGCGREVPLPKTLYTARMAPQYYMGVDAGPIEAPDWIRKFSWFHSQQRKDFCKEYTETELREADINVVTCFEVLEHVEPSDAICILDKISVILDKPGSKAYVSTPNYDPSVGEAANHVNEMKHFALQNMIREAGISIEKKFGTFASIRDYERHVDVEFPGLLKRLREYYDTNVLSVICAPLYPELSRNCLWVLQSSRHDTKHESRPWESIKEPWGSSSKYKEMKR